MNELPFEKNISRTPAEIFKTIDNQSVNKIIGESLIRQYGDHRVRETMADLQKKMGIELTEEVGQRINRIEKFIDDFYEKMIEICLPSKKRKGKK
jgi:uncharacterized NAD-dependent epimerase/dehydratase family protein